MRLECTPQLPYWTNCMLLWCYLLLLSETLMRLCVHHLTVRFDNAGFADVGDKMPQMTGWETVPQRQADLVPLRVAVQHARTPAEAVTAQAALDAELSRRRQIDASVRLAVSDLLHNEAVDNLMQVCSAFLLGVCTRLPSMGRLFHGLTLHLDVCRPHTRPASLQLQWAHSEMLRRLWWSL